MNRLRWMLGIGLLGAAMVGFAAAPCVAVAAALPVQDVFIG